MPQRRVVGIGLTCFVLGLVVQAGFAQVNRLTYSPDLYRNQDPKAAGQALLDGALQLSEGGSWERIAVGRAWFSAATRLAGRRF